MASRGSSWESILAQSDAVQRIFSYLTASDLARLRRASLHCRKTANAAVTTVGCTPDNPQLSTDLDSRFPNATSLHLSFTSRPQADLSILLQYLAAASPAFVARVASLHLDLGLTSPSDEAYEDVLWFLSRCTSLQELELRVSRLGIQMETHFKGRGHTPQERRDNMQQQLAAIRASPHIIAPASWPACQCLVSLHLSFIATALEPELAAAASQTASLRSLELNYSTEHLPAWQAISGLSQLTSLGVNAVVTAEDSPWQQRQGMVAAIASLRSLVQLAVDTHLLASPHPDTGCRIPSSWSNLSRLTKLDVRCPAPQSLPLAPVPTLPALQQLSLNNSHTSCLSDLFALTSLTSIICSGDWSEQPAAAANPAGGQQQGAGGQQQVEVPQQWRAGMRKLAWTFSRADMRIISELTSLTNLLLYSIPLTPSLCCSLARLPHLERLQLLSATITTNPDGFPWEFEATAFRPTFPSLRFLSCSATMITSLALWTNVPPGLTLSRAGYGFLAQAKDGIFRGWGSGWLAAVLRDDPFRSTVRLLVQGDDEVRDLVRAAGSLPDSAGAASSASNSPLLLVLGQHVTGAGLAHLLQGCPALDLGSPSEAHRQVAPHLGRGLMPHHVKHLSGLSAPNLRRLKVADCCGWGMLELAALVAAAPNLTQLVLQKVPALNDCMVCMLVACPLLEVLEVVALRTEVSDQSVAVLLSTLRRLWSLEVSVADAPEALKCLTADVKRAWKQAPGGRFGTEGPALLRAVRTRPY